MEVLSLVLIALLIVYLRNSLSADIKDLRREITVLRELILYREEKKKSSPQESPLSSQPQPEKTEPIKPQPKEVYVEPIAETFEPVREEYTPIEPKIQLTFKTEEKAPPVSQTPYTPPEPKISFFEKHPDLEKFIGENLINKIGIAILVLGIAFFVKYAIDKDWINEIGRVCIGIACGGILIGIAHRLRNSFKAFSSVLIGGGLSILYFTIAIAFHEYSLFSQTSAFAIMVVITAFSVVLGIIYNRIEIVVLALIGGFSTPFIVSTGEGNYKVLFTYLMILNCGMLFLAYRKKWNLVNILSYIFTLLIYGSWIILKDPTSAGFPHEGAFLFATAFYIIFFLMNVIYNVRNRKEFGSLDIGILISNTFLYYSAGMTILQYYHHGDYQGIFTALLGVYNFAFAYAFYRNQNIDKKLIFLLIGLVLTFISLTAPVQLEGNFITLFWSAEALLLLWFSRKSGIRLIKVTSVIVTILMLVSLLRDWSESYVITPMHYMEPFINKIFITGIVAIISLIGIRKLLNKENDKYFPVNNFSLELATYKNFIFIALSALIYFTFFFEMRYQLIHYDVDWDNRSICEGIYNLSFLAIVFAVLRNKVATKNHVVLTVGSILCIFIYIFTYDSSVVMVRNSYLEESGSALFFMLHFPLAILFAFAIYIFNQSSKIALKNSDAYFMIKWVTVLLVVYLMSAELNHIVTWLSYSPGRIIREINKQVSKAGYSVLWGIISLFLMRFGMKRKDRTVRIISLSLFLVTILKLFLWDLVGISESGKIIAFISLGILLLIVSFMYQRLKKIILANESNAPVNENNP